MAYDKEKAKSEYSQKLRNPRWQKMRLDVMNRDEFRCQICFDDKTPLNVHHNYYRPGNDPWDYPLAALVTLCETCHEEETETRRGEEQALLDVLRIIGMKATHVNGLMYGLLRTFGERPQFPDNWDYTLSKFLQFFFEISEDVDALTEEARRQHTKREG